MFYFLFGSCCCCYRCFIFCLDLAVAVVGVFICCVDLAVVVVGVFIYCVDLATLSLLLLLQMFLFAVWILPHCRYYCC